MDDHRDSARDQLAQQVLKQFRLIYGSMKQHLREGEESWGVSGSRMAILQEVARQPGVGITELAGRLAIHQSTCSILVDKLEARGLVIKKRSRGDQRRVGLSVSAEAQRLLAAAPRPAEPVLPEALNAMPDGALESLSHNLSQLIRELEKPE